MSRTNGLNVPAELDGVDGLSPYGVHMRYGTSRRGALDRDHALAWAATAIEWAQDVVEPPTA
jgi:hypothetical protein